MKKILIIVLSCVMLSAHAQVNRVKWKQIATGTNGQVAMVGVDGNGAWVTPPFMVYTDTTSLIATKDNVTQAILREVVATSFNNGTLTLTKANGNTVTVSLDGRYVLQSTIGQPNGVTPLGADGKVPPSFLPAMTGRNTYVVNNMTEMLALNALMGDVAVRLDSNRTFILQGTNPTVYTNWVLLPDQSGGGGSVLSVNNQTGNVTLNTDNISEGTTNKYYLDSRARLALSATTPIVYNNSTGAFTHATSGVTAGTYNNVTVNTFGHVTAGSNVTYVVPADLTNFYTKTQLQTSGQSVVDWGNIANKPSNIAGTESKEEFTSSTSSSITVAHTPNTSNILKLFLNGVLLSANDYTRIGSSITLAFPRESTDVITAVYNF